MSEEMNTNPAPDNGRTSNLTASLRSMLEIIAVATVGWLLHGSISGWEILWIEWYIACFTGFYLIKFATTNNDLTES